MSSKKSSSSNGIRYGRYLGAGVVLAGIIFALFKLTESDKKDDSFRHEWSYAVDSAFVMNCVNKYSREFGKDTLKRQYSIEFCLCMLDKVKSKYSEEEMNNVTDAEIKEWDRVCRNEINYKGRPTPNTK